MGRHQLILIDGIIGTNKSDLKNALQNSYSSDLDDVDEMRRDHNLLQPWGKQSPEAILEDWDKLKEMITSSSNLCIGKGLLVEHSLATMLGHRTDRNQLKSYATQILNILVQLDTLLIYLHSGQVQELLDAATKSHHGTWQVDQIKKIEDIAYTQHHNLTGYRGWIKFWNRVQDLTVAILSMYDNDLVMVDPTKINQDIVNDIVRMINR